MLSVQLVSRSSTFLLTLAAALIVGLLTGDSAAADTCAGDALCGFHPCATPARGVAEALWGELRPSDVGALPPERDSTDFDQIGVFDNRNPYWMSLDAENGFLFAATNAGFEVWDLRQDPDRPRRLANVDFYSAVPFWSQNFETKFYLHDVDAPPGEDGVVAVAGRDGVGLLIWDTSVKQMPRLLYQDHGLTAAHKFGYEVYATTIGGRHLAFLAAENLGGGLYVYDLSAAQEVSAATPCLEAQPEQPNFLCRGVYLGRLGGRSRASYVDGAGDLVAFSSGTSPRGVEIWDVGNPLAPRRLVEDLTNEAVFGLAIWQAEEHSFLALRLPGEGRIYDITCLEQGSCTQLGVPIATFPLNHASRAFLTFSESGGRRFVHTGVEKICAGPVLQEEWLYDVTDPVQPRDITPPPQVIDGRLTGYWGWSYPLNPTGFNFVAPRRGLFFGSRFYRAAQAIFDVHRLGIGGTAPAVAAVTAAPNPALLCQQIIFEAQDLAGEPPLHFAWEIHNSTGQTVATAGDMHPLLWTSPSTLPPGLYTAEFTVSNAHGSATTTSPPVRLDSLPPLEFTGPTGGPVHDPPAGFDVQFYLEDQGATEWLWSFGDGTLELFADPVQGRNPLHTYAAPGSYPVFVIIRNCLSVFGQVSSPIFVTVPGAGPEAIFRDGFETGGMSRWSRSESGG